MDVVQCGTGSLTFLDPHLFQLYWGKMYKSYKKVDVMQLE